MLKYVYLFIHLFIHSTNIIHSVPGHLEETFFSSPISCLPGRSVNWAISEADVEIKIEFSTKNSMLAPSLGIDFSVMKVVHSFHFSSPDANNHQRPKDNF